MKISAADIEVILGPVVSLDADDPIHYDGGKGDPDHEGAVDRLGHAQPLRGLPENHERDDDEGDRIHQGGQYAHAMRAVSALRAGGLGRGPESVPGQDQGEPIGEVMTGVGEQSQTMREIARHGFAEDKENVAPTETPSRRNIVSESAC